MTGKYQLQSTDLSIDGLGIDLGWYYNVCPEAIGDFQLAIDAPETVSRCLSNDVDAKPTFDNSVSPLAQFQPCSSVFGNLGCAVDPKTLWSTSMDGPNMAKQQPEMQTSAQSCSFLSMPTTAPCSSPSSTTRRSNSIQPSRLSSTSSDTVSYERSLCAQGSATASMTSASAVSSSSGESEKTRRARYAANQRHGKDRKAHKDSRRDENVRATDGRVSEEKQRHREKNKVAAAKCRSRQRKRHQTVQEKGARLSEENARLKAMVQELRMELHGLRSLALNHQQCDCSVARYNYEQAQRFVAEYH